MSAHDMIDSEFADSWTNSVTADLERSRGIAWIVACGAALTAVLLAIALVLLLPLKTVEPYTLLVDRQTGHVEALAPLNAQTVSADAALTRSFLVQYVIAREGFNGADLQQDYRKVSLFSAPRARQRYQSSLQASNPESPLAYLPNGGKVDVEVRSVSSLAASRSLVRFTTVRRDPGARAQEAQHWAAVVDWEYSGAQMNEADRMINPLGFQVTRYRRSAETLPEAVEAQLPTEAPMAKAQGEAR